MKVCPQCNAQYEDSMFFCLQDGKPLKSTDNSLQSNPATFEKTLTMPTDEKTLDLPAQNQLTGEKTLTLSSETVTDQKSVETEAWQPVTTVPQPIPTSKTDENTVLASSADSNKNHGKGVFFILGGILGGIVLLGTAVGGWWFLQKPSSEVVTANTNRSSENSNNTLGLSNSNLSVAFGENNSNLNNSNISVNNNSNVSVNNNKSTPKPSPTATKDQKNSPTPTPSPNQTPEPTSTPQSTPTPKTPTSTPMPTPTRNPPNKTVSGGVLNGRAINLVKPPYPPVAKAVKAGGAVNVLVTIDENGNVIRASAVSGHPLLRGAAEAAARASKFSPPMVNGQPVKVTGVIVYNFTAQ